MPPHLPSILCHLRRLTAPAASDAALLARWRDQRDEAAFADLVARHGPMVLGVCRRVLGDVQHAEDAFQATFLVLARKAASLRRPEALPSFLYGVALRLARKSRGAIRRQAVPSCPEAPEPADPHPHPLDVLTGRELLAVLDEEIARLPEAYRLPLLLCVLQGRSVEEAARMLGWSIGSVRGRLARGRERLRQRLTRRGLGLSEGAIALLAPVAVPERLLADSIRNLAAPISPAVSALAAGSASALKKAVCLSILVVAAGLGSSLLFVPAPQPETPFAPAPAAPPAQAKNESRRDRYGDPLPPGAIARLGTLRFRAPGEIVALAFAPDGKTLAVSSHGGGLFLMDAASGKRIRRFPTGTENPIVFSPDGKRLISRGHKAVGQSLQPVVRVWELAGEQKPREYDIGPWVLWVGWSAEGRPLAIRVEDNGALHFHELSAGRSRRFACAKPYKYPSGFISRDPPAACSPSGHALAVPDTENVIHVWDTATGRERCTFQPQPKGGDIFSLTFSPDGSRLAIRTLGGVQMWDTAKSKVVYTVDMHENYGPPIFAPNGKTMAIADSSRTIRIWDAATGKERGRIEDKDPFTATTARFALSADGKWLATATYAGSTFRVWDVASGQREHEPAGHLGGPHGTAFAPDGRRVATGGSLDGTIYIWDLESSESLTRIQRPGLWVRNIAFSPDGRSLFSTWTDDELWISGAVSGGRLHVLKLEDPDRPDTYQSAISMYQSADGKTLVALSFYYARNNKGMRNATLITGWDTSTRKQLFRRRRPGMDSWVALSPDARVLAVPHPAPEREGGAGQGPMRLEDVATGELLLTFPTLAGQTWPLTFSPDGRLLASNNYDWKRKDKKGDPTAATRSALHLWETATAAEVLTLPLESQYRTAFSPDGQLLALIAPGQGILLYDLAHSRELRRFKGFDAGVTYLAFSPDGHRLLSGLSDSTLLVWDVPKENPPLAKLGTDGVAKAWTDLAGSDAPRAFRARWALVSAPEEAIPFLKEHLHPAQAADPQRLRRLLADLESGQFAVREKAQAELEELGDLAEPALRKTLENKPTLEVRRRVQAVLERLRGPVTRPEMLRSLRAVAVLEDIPTPEAWRLLEELAQGAPEARLTREAKASLRRLHLRTSTVR